MPILLSPLGVGHSVPIVESLYDRNQFEERNLDLSTERQEATFGSSTTVAIAQEPKVLDHMLLTIQTMINGIPLCAIVDSGATRSFVDEKLWLHPQLDFLGPICHWRWRMERQ